MAEAEAPRNKRMQKLSYKSPLRGMLLSLLWLVDFCFLCMLIYAELIMEASMEMSIKRDESLTNSPHKPRSAQINIWFRIAARFAKRTKIDNYS